MSRSLVTMTLRVEVAPWVTPFVAAMLRLSHTERFKATLSTFVIDHGTVRCP
jgi:hypothetical protein